MIFFCTNFYLKTLIIGFYKQKTIDILKTERGYFLKNRHGRSFK